MEEYFIATLSVSVFLALVDVLVTKTQNGKFVKMVISLILVTVLAVPIIKIIGNNNFTLDDKFSSLGLETELIELEKDILTEKIEKTLTNNSIEFLSVDVQVSHNENGYVIDKIIIKFSKNVINSDSERINMLEKMKTLLKSIISNGDIIQVESGN